MEGIQLSKSVYDLFWMTEEYIYYINKGNTMYNALVHGLASLWPYSYVQMCNL